MLNLHYNESRRRIILVDISAYLEQKKKTKSTNIIKMLLAEFKDNLNEIQLQDNSDKKCFHRISSTRIILNYLD